MLERTEWLAQRRRLITGTDIAAICGVDPYRTKMDVFIDKHYPKERDTNEHMYWGITLEAPIADTYAKRNNVQLREGSIVIRDWRGGTPDRIIVDQPKGLEVKTAGLRMSHLWGDAGTDDIPTNYLLQCAWYMSLCDFPSWDVAVLIGGQEYRQYTLKRNLDLEGTILTLAEDFYRSHVLRFDPPQIDNSESSNRWLKQRYPSDVIPKLVPSTRDLDEMAHNLNAIKQQISDLTKEADLIENSIKLSIGDHEGVVGSDWRATWKKAKSTKTVDWEKIAIALSPSQMLIDSHTREREGSRRFIFKVNS